MRTNNIPHIITANAIMNATINSLAVPLYQVYGYSIQIVFTGTPTGSFKLQASDDPVPQAGSPSITAQATPTNWTDIVNSTQAITAAGSIIWTVTDAFYNWVRVVYTDTSGGTSTAIVTVSTYNGKGV